MKLYLTDQRNKLKLHLGFLKSQKVMNYDRRLLLEKTTIIKLETSLYLAQLNLDFLFDYKIFPDNIMTFITQWQDEKRKMKIGDTIAQQVYVPPIQKFSQKIILGVRINEVIDEVDKKGFSYETLHGHVEKGISTFTVEQKDNQMMFKIQTYSKPGNFLSRLLGPVFSIPYQTFCTNAALRHVKQQIDSQ